MSKPVVAAQEVKLRCHPTISHVAIDEILVTVQRPSVMQLQLSYRVSADLAQLRVPAIVTAARRDELWRHTCAELFVATPDQASYVEFNLAPSTCWAAYEFSSYRQDMRSITVAAPDIAVKQREQLLEMDVRVQLPAQFASAASLQASLTMVIEDGAGQFSYWAVQHAAAKPDFHCRDSFVVNI